MAITITSTVGMVSFGADELGNPVVEDLRFYQVDTTEADRDNDHIILVLDQDPETGQDITLRFVLDDHPIHRLCLRLDFDNSDQRIVDGLRKTISELVVGADVSDITAYYGLNEGPADNILSIMTPAVLIVCAGDMGFAVSLESSMHQRLEAGSLNK